MSKNKITASKFLGKTWIDIQDPSKTELKKLAQKYNLHDSDTKECLDQIQIAKTYEHPSYIFIVIHAALQQNEDEILIEEIDIFFSRRFIISIHQHPLPAIDRIIEKINDQAHHHPHFKKSTEYVLHELIRKVTNNNFAIISNTVSKIKKLEKELITGDFKTSIGNVLLARKNILQIKAITQPNLVVTKEILKSKIIQNYSTSQVYFDALIESQEKTLNIAKHYQDLIDGMIDISDILTSHKINDVMRILTIISVSLMPLTLIAGIFGMNFESLDFYGTSYGFFITIFIMIILEIIIIQYFKYKKWL
ncbi:MAG: magnesium transporter CorA family protein [Patescibacteria group bacterium]